MEKKRGKPTQRGMGSPHDVTDSEPPPSFGLSRKTHRGLGDSQPPKLVTMHGVAPPSDRPPPLETLIAADSAVEYSGDDLSLRHGDIPRFAAHELPPGVASEATDDDELREPQLGDRSQFRTAPGGGKNRLSGGRAAAAAYVSPSTLSPGHGTDPRVQPVEVAEHVLREARSFQTEPSLAKKRASQMPPEAEPIAPPMVRRSAWWGPAAGLMAALLVVGTYFSFGSTTTEVPVLKKNAALAESAPSSIPTASTAAEARLPEPSSEFAAPTAPPLSPAAPAREEASPVVSPDVNPAQSPSSSATSSPQKRRNEDSAGPKNSHASPSSTKPASKPVSTKKRDLWLE